MLLRAFREIFRHIIVENYPSSRINWYTEESLTFRSSQVSPQQQSVPVEPCAATRRSQNPKPTIPSPKFYQRGTLNCASSYNQFSCGSQMIMVSDVGFPPPPPRAFYSSKHSLPTRTTTTVCTLPIGVVADSFHFVLYISVRFCTRSR